jgi:hypothetical protein
MDGSSTGWCAARCVFVLRPQFSTWAPPARIIPDTKLIWAAGYFAVTLALIVIAYAIGVLLWRLGYPPGPAHRILDVKHRFNQSTACLPVSYFDAGNAAPTPS